MKVWKHEKKKLHLHALKKGYIDKIYANYCTISPKRKSNHNEEKQICCFGFLPPEKRSLYSSLHHNPKKTQLSYA